MTEPVYQSPPVLVFVHIPKTAGTTLRAILNMNEPGARSKALANVFKGGGGLSKAPVESMRRGSGPRLKEGVRILRGHFPLGIREYLPRYVPNGREVRCFSFLREPAERTLSHYFAIRSVGGGYRLPPLAPEATLDDALEGGYVHDNLHTRMLCDDPEPFGEVTEEMLMEAKRNLRSELVFFGLTERFDESLVLAKQRLGLRTILYRSTARVNAARPRGDEIPKELRRMAERCNRYDIELYRYAVELFDAAPERGELEFQVELAALRAAKGDGEVDLEVPAPEAFGADEQAWRMLLDSRRRLLDLEWQRTRHRAPRIPATVQAEVRENELREARSKVRKLESEAERLRSGNEFQSALSREKELEAEVKRLKAASKRTEKLERQLKRLTGARSRNKELREEIRRLKEASEAG
jgi:hypothetical protein